MVAMVAVAEPCQTVHAAIGPRTGVTPARSAPRLGSPLLHLSAPRLGEFAPFHKDLHRVGAVAEPDRPHNRRPPRIGVRRAAASRSCTPQQRLRPIAVHCAAHRGAAARTHSLQSATYALNF